MKWDSRMGAILIAVKELIYPLFWQLLYGGPCWKGVGCHLPLRQHRSCFSGPTLVPIAAHYALDAPSVFLLKPGLISSCDVYISPVTRMTALSICREITYLPSLQR